MCYLIWFLTPPLLGRGCLTLHFFDEENGTLRIKWHTLSLRHLTKKPKQKPSHLASSNQSQISSRLTRKPMLMWTEGLDPEVQLYLQPLSGHLLAELLFSASCATRAILSPCASEFHAEITVSSNPSQCYSPLRNKSYVCCLSKTIVLCLMRNKMWTIQEIWSERPNRSLADILELPWFNWQ